MLAAGTQAPVAPGTVSPLDLRVSFLWKEIVGPIEPFLETVARRLVDQVESFDPEIAQYARYALTNGGKQLRPVLVGLSGRSIGQLNDDIILAAVIIEMIHLATLVHDDIVDAAEIRRRRPTLAANWGNEISVLLGDCLFAQALKLSAEHLTLPVCQAVASATKTVCSGEILQTLRRRRVSGAREEYFKILAMKTGELFALSCDLGARLAGGADGERLALRDYGLAFGTAYQVYDDCLDVFGTEAAAGKSLGTDLANGKLTLPTLVVLERASEPDRLRLRELFREWRPECLPDLMALLREYDALGESRRVICDYVKTARKALALLPSSTSRESLIQLTELLAQQTRILGGHADRSCGHEDGNDC